MTLTCQMLQELGNSHQEEKREWNYSLRPSFTIMKRLLESWISPQLGMTTSLHRPFPLWNAFSSYALITAPPVPGSNTNTSSLKSYLKKQGGIFFWLQSSDTSPTTAICMPLLFPSLFLFSALFIANAFPNTPQEILSWELLPFLVACITLTQHVCGRPPHL